MEASGMAMVNLERSQTVDSVAMQSRPKAKTEHLATVTSLRAGYLNQYVRRLHSLRQENPLWVEIELQERIHQYKNRYETRKKVSELMLHHFKLDSLHLKGSNTDLLQDFDSLYLKLH